MLRSLTSGVSGMQQFQQRLDVIGNNIANVNTSGFKSARVDFEDGFSQTLRAAGPGGNNTSNTSAVQVGSGVATSAIRNQFTQGAVTSTGVATDLAVSGDGFFVVRDPVSGAEYATRAGDFRLDESGFLVTNRGFRVQGISDGNINTAPPTRGDILIDAGTPPDDFTGTIAPGATLASFSINNEGVVSVRLSDGSEYKRGQILLQKFTDPQALTKEGGNLYSGLDLAGPLSGGLGQPPGTNGLGGIRSGALELSNVDLANEFSGLITTQRAFQASARIITTSDEILQELVNLKR